MLAAGSTVSAIATATGLQPAILAAARALASSRLARYRSVWAFKNLSDALVRQRTTDSARSFGDRA